MSGRSKSVPSSPFTLHKWTATCMLSCSFLPSCIYLAVSGLVVARRFSVAVWDCLLQLMGSADVVCGPSCPNGMWDPGSLTAMVPTCPALRPTLSQGTTREVPVPSRPGPLPPVAARCRLSSCPLVLQVLVLRGLQLCGPLLHA